MSEQFNPLAAARDIRIASKAILRDLWRESRRLHADLPTTT